MRKLLLFLAGLALGLGMAGASWYDAGTSVGKSLSLTDNLTVGGTLTLGGSTVNHTAIEDIAGNATRIADLETNLLANNTRIGTLEINLAANATRVGVLETDLRANDTRLGTVETDLASNATRIETLETDLPTNVTRIETLETDTGANATRVGTLETDLGVNTTRVGTLETDLGLNATRIGTLETDLGNNATRITNQETYLGTNVTYLGTNATKADNALSWLVLNDTRIISLETNDSIITWKIDATSVDENIFVADDAWQITKIEEVHAVAGDNGGAVTLNVRICDGTEAPASGDAAQSAAFDLKGTANTIQTATLSATKSLVDGDRLALDYTGTLTTLAGGVVTVHMKRV